MKGYRLVAFFLAFALSILVIDKLSSREPTPRVRDGKEYRQWWCPRCERSASGYGPPYTCGNCGKVLY